jgi:hypothetical protein
LGGEAVRSRAARNPGQSTRVRGAIIGAIRDWRRDRQFWLSDELVMELAYRIERRVRAIAPSQQADTAV